MQIIIKKTIFEMLAAENFIFLVLTIKLEIKP